jgi:DNA adenine methylase
VLFNIQPSTAYINDANGELINVYEVIRDNVEELISSLQQHKNEFKSILYNTTKQ